MEKEARSCSSPLQENVNWGPGLFVSDRAQASFDAAYSRIGDFLRAEGLAPASADEEVRQKLLETCRYYWSDYEYDNRERPVAIREEVTCLSDASNALLAAINGLSKETRARLEWTLRPSQARGATLLPKICEDLDRLRSVCLPIVGLRGSKKGSSRSGVTNCCSRLIDLRARLTGKAFAKTWTVKPNVANRTEEFVGRDAQFILETVRAIDDEVMFASVRSAGMTLARQSASKK